MTAPSAEPPVRYALPARVLHWIVAAAVFAQLPLGWAADRTPDRAASFELLRTHYQLGMLVLALMTLRVAWRIAYGAQRPPSSEPLWRRWLAYCVQAMLYFLLLALPVSGYVIWVWMGAPMTLVGLVDAPRVFTPPSEDESGRAYAWYIHHYSALLVAGLIAMHVTAAFWHAVMLGDGVIARIWFGRHRKAARSIVGDSD